VPALPPCGPLRDTAIRCWPRAIPSRRNRRRFLKQRPLLAAALGAICAPGAYYAGYKLGGVQITDFPAAMAALALGWSLFMPLLMRLSERLDGYGPAPSASGLAGSAHV